jgi:hypothetical protein
LSTVCSRMQVTTWVHVYIHTYTHTHTHTHKHTRLIVQALGIRAGH